ncbi:response regulator transcription factor [Massilia solisilvae]|uniref:Response regulator transcription factor n=1 Tax=Massilia solisilvae TaxID=1811225 RepID=A0ABT2BLQ2_9BURK|nr:response regulator transcription factor [Massilia solisilvae]MCS0608808.1 response regulator transcription factor [Massilia solisilvae]
MFQCLLIEDDAETLSYLSKGLERNGYAVTPCEDGIRAAQLLERGGWDVVVLDRMLPGVVDGLALLRSIRSRSDDTPVLVLSALNSVDERVRGLHAGGDDYLAKPFELAELVARVENLVRRAASARLATQLQVADLQLDLRAMRASRAGQPIALQPREFRLLEYLMRHEGQIVTRRMLLEDVWDYHFDPQTNVIDVQVSRLRSKVDKGFDLPLIHTVRGTGYTLKVPASGEAFDL